MHSEDLIKKLPIKAQNMFKTAYNASLKKHDENTSFKVAWESIKPYFHKKDGEWIAQGMGYDLFTFELENKDNSMFIQQAEDGNYYMEAMLADLLPVADGWAFTEEALQDYANQINEFGILGGITHSEYQDLMNKYSHLPAEEFIAHARTERKGILKSVKAVYEKGKLWIKALIDKRYINHAKKYNKISLEAYIPKKLQVNGKYLGGHILGMALDNRAKNQRTSVTFK